MKKKCSVTNKNRLVSFEESRSKLIIENSKRTSATKVKVDNCEVTTGLRCDYLFLINEIEIFIELKGHDINHAIKQLEATIKKLSSNPKNQKKKSFVISRRSPLSSASIQNIRVKFMKNYNSELIIKNSPYKHRE